MRWLPGAAPLPTEALGRRADRRRRRRGTFAIASPLMVVLLIGLTALVSDTPGGRTVTGEPRPTVPTPLQAGAGTTTLDLGLLDGTRLSVALPERVGAAFARVTPGAFERHGSVQAGPGSARRWRIDVTFDSIDRIMVGNPLSIPPSTTVSAALVDRTTRRLGLQFGSWAVVASGDTLTSADIDLLLAGIAIAGTPDGFPEYKGSLPLSSVDGPDVMLSANAVALSAFVRECSTSVGQPTRAGLLVEDRSSPNVGTATSFCDPVNRIAIRLDGAAPLSGEEVDRVKVQVLSVGSFLATVRGRSTIAPAAPTTSKPTPLEPPDSRFPTAGICAQASGVDGNVRVGDTDLVLQPRCLVLRGDQRLSVTNVSDRPWRVTLGLSFGATVGPGETHLFDAPLGTHLAPGVHRLRASSFTADIWVDAVCTGPEGSPPCSTP